MPASITTCSSGLATVLGTLDRETITMTAKGQRRRRPTDDSCGHVAHRGYPRTRQLNTLNSCLPAESVEAQCTPFCLSAYCVFVGCHRFVPLSGAVTAICGRAWLSKLPSICAMCSAGMSCFCAPRDGSGASRIPEDLDACATNLPVRQSSQTSSWWPFVRRQKNRPEGNVVICVMQDGYVLVKG